MFQDLGLTMFFGLVLLFLSVPLILFLVWYFHNKNKSQRSVLINFPLPGRVSYFLEILFPYPKT